MSLTITVNGRLAISQTIPSSGGGALTIELRFRWWRRTQLSVTYADGATQFAQEVSC